MSIKKTHNVIIESVTATQIHTSLLKDYPTVIIDASPLGKSTPVQLSMAVIRKIGHTGRRCRRLIQRIFEKKQIFDRRNKHVFDRGRKISYIRTVQQSWISKVTKKIIVLYNNTACLSLF